MSIPRQSEAGFSKTFALFVRLNGWKSYHARPGLTKRGKWVTAVAGDGKGFLDWVLVRERVVWVELKVPPNKVTSDQQAWIDALRRADEEVHVFYPSQWAEIERVLG